MRKLSKTFLTVAGIIAVISIFVFIGYAIFCFACRDLSDDTMRTLISPYYDFVPGDSLAEKIAFARRFLKLVGYFMIAEGVLAVPTAVVCFTSRSKSSAGLYITAIILNVLVWCVFGILGGIFGLVANGQEARQQQNPNVVDAQ